MADPVAVSGSRNEETRRRNLSAVLASVHYDGPLSRAELTRRTGLNRSTVKALVDDLVRHGLAYETEAAASAGVGRPSPLVHPDPRVTALAVNPDVDAVIVGVVALGGRVMAQERFEMDRIPTVSDTIEVTRAALRSMDGAADARAIGIAVPGLVLANPGVVVRAPHLGWRDEPVAQAFSQSLGLPAVVANDAHSGLVGESRFGAARGIPDLVFLNGSTSGIGGGAIVAGRTLLGADGFAGEFGHTTVRPGGDPCGCGRRGCLETEVNLQRFEMAAGDAHFDPDNLDATLAHPSAAIDAEADRQADVLAGAIANTVSTFNPGMVVLAGFLGALYSARTDRLSEAVRREAFAPLADRLQFRRAVLGRNRLLVGAADQALARLLADPLGSAPALDAAR